MKKRSEYLKILLAETEKMEDSCLRVIDILNAFDSKLLSSATGALDSIDKMKTQIRENFEFEPRDSPVKEKILRELEKKSRKR